MNKISHLYISLTLIVHWSALFDLVAAHADHLAPEIKTQVNQQTDLFEKSVNDFKGLEQQLEASKQTHINALGDGNGNTPEGLSYITTKSKNELRQESSKLQAIPTNDLDMRGRDEMIKNNTINELYTDYSRPLHKQHMRDASVIAESQDDLLANLLGKLKELGVDCKTVKGDKKYEPEYFLQIKTTSHKDTVYNQKFCEELRNQYNCTDTLTLSCNKIGIRYKEWQDRVMYLGGFEFWFDYHGWTHTIKCRRGYWSVHMRQGRRIDAERRNMIANRLGVNLEQVDGGTAPWDGEGKITHVEGVHHVFQRYAINYRYRDSYPVCEEWSEDWTERCRLK